MKRITQIKTGICVVLFIPVIIVLTPYTYYPGWWERLFTTMILHGFLPWLWWTVNLGKPSYAENLIRVLFIVYLTLRLGDAISMLDKYLHHIPHYVWIGYLVFNEVICIESFIKRIKGYETRNN